MKTLKAKTLLNIYGTNENAQSLAEIFGVSRGTICRWRNRPNELLNIYQADKYACRIGLHPANVWENWFKL